MINIKYNNDSITISGHSTSDVCAAISSITYTGVNFLSEYRDNCIDFTDDGINMVVKILEHDDTIDKIFSTMIKMYQDVVDQVPEDCINLENMI